MEALVGTGVMEAVVETVPDVTSVLLVTEDLGAVTNIIDPVE